MMLLARKLLDNFIDNLAEDFKKDLYDLAEVNIDESIAKIAIVYEETFKDYPSGMVLDMLIQHLKDKVFQRTKKATA